MWSIPYCNVPAAGLWFWSLKSVFLWSPGRLKKLQIIDYRTTIYWVPWVGKSQHRLRNSSEDIFEDSISLKEINLSSNKIRVLDERLWKIANFWIVFHLNNNKICQIRRIDVQQRKFLDWSDNELPNFGLNFPASALSILATKLLMTILKSIISLTIEELKAESSETSQIIL